MESLTCASTNAQTGYPVAAFERMARGTDVWNTTKKQAALRPCLIPRNGADYNPDCGRLSAILALDKRGAEYLSAHIRRHNDLSSISRINGFIRRGQRLPQR